MYGRLRGTKYAPCNNLNGSEFIFVFNRYLIYHMNVLRIQTVSLNKKSLKNTASYLSDEILGFAM